MQIIGTKTPAGWRNFLTILLIISPETVLAQLKTTTIKVFPAPTGKDQASKPVTSKHPVGPALKSPPQSQPKAQPPKVILQVEIADTEATQAYGLSHRRWLPEKQGMLFVFKNNTQGSFWGKNTLIPLDLVYIDQNRKITQISQIKPHDLTPVPSQHKIQYALELNQGVAQKYGLQVGDQLEWR